MSTKTQYVNNPPTHNRPVILVFARDFAAPSTEVVRYEDGKWVQTKNDIALNSLAIYPECYWFEIPARPEEDIYKFVERVGKRVSERYGLAHNPGEYSIAADKARQYREEWEKTGVPFLYGVFIYVMSTTYPYCTQIEERSQIAEWVSTFWHENPSFQRIIREEDTGKAFFTIYWRYGKRQVLLAEPGEPIHKAFTRAGYGSGATAAIDHYQEGDVDTRTWNSESNTWEPKEPVFNPE